MANYDQLDARVTVIENIILNSVTLPKISVDVNDTKISDKTGFLVYGEISGINDGKLFVGVSLVASPTLDAHIEEPFVFKAF